MIQADGMASEKVELLFLLRRRAARLQHFICEIVSDPRD